ncbi:hypothetical protein GCM10009039_30980 [Halocalculus aciditolerans]|uniref:Uncharacterized protein n=1 Tax=Halocalculus aciditolerans TaxID=1383812 RepID=A0A830F7G1_9EURY|nr:hypothetical protein GCM10009039_30980 [Halocalculus aciditolerans]
MADDEEEETQVELGPETPVEGAPLARVASRLTWGLEKSEVVRREGDVEVRTADGPVRLADALDGVDDTYFSSRNAFVDAVRAELPDGPVPAGDPVAETADADTDADADEGEASEAAADDE